MNVRVNMYLSVCVSVSVCMSMHVRGVPERVVSVT